jgi:2-dehydro-3-deoxyphosphooctonate aldolase (KDO 8-P synthase)
MGYNDLVVDPRSFYHMERIGYPVVFDITHAIRKYGIPSADAKGGAREFLPVLSGAGVASGVDGIFIETHPDPEKALCDAASQLSVYALEEFLKPLLELHAIEVKYKKLNKVIHRLFKHKKRNMELYLDSANLKEIERRLQIRFP